MISPETEARMRKLAQQFAGADRSLFLVGGIVRDSMLGLVHDDGDIDLATDALPAETKRLVSPIADAVWTQGERFGTIGCTIDGFPFEITTFRGESYDARSRKPDVVFTDALESDLSRRDFTINAVAIDVLTNEVHDPFEGMRDLQDQVLRTPLSPDVSFSDDPLRMLRAARFIARFDLTVMPEIETAISRHRERLAIVSAERVRDELFKLLMVRDPRRGLQFLVDHQLLRRWLPELTEPALPPDADVDTTQAIDTARVIDAVAASPLELPVRVAALLFDLGGANASPAERASLARRRLGELRCSTEQRRQMATVVEMAGRILALTAPIADSEVRRIVRDARDELGWAVLLAQSLTGTALPDRSPATVAEFAIRRSELGEHPDDLGPELDGREVMAIVGGGPGAEVGHALHFLGELRLARGVVGREEATRLLREWWEQRHQPESD